MNEHDTCAGKPISSSMIRYSDILLDSCKHFVNLQKSESDDYKIIYYNTSIITGVVASIEARLNEHISMATNSSNYDGSTNTSLKWAELSKGQKNTSIKDKWNSIAKIQNTQCWASGDSPYQSADTLISLRNELIHYKGDFLAKGEIPIKRFGELYSLFNIKSVGTFVEDDVSSWIFDLLSTRDLGNWSLSAANNLKTRFYQF